MVRASASAADRQVLEGKREAVTIFSTIISCDAGLNL